MCCGTDLPVLTHDFQQERDQTQTNDISCHSHTCPVTIKFAFGLPGHPHKILYLFKGASRHCYHVFLCVGVSQAHVTQFTYVPLGTVSATPLEVNIKVLRFEN